MSDYAIIVQNDEAVLMFVLRVTFLISLVLLPLQTIADEKCGPYDGVDLTDDPVLLEKILRSHDEWLAESERGDDDPRRANLCGADMAMISLSWTSGKLDFANLREADLEFADLSKAQLERADMRTANLAHASLTEAVLRRADLSNSNLLQADLSKADLSDSKAHNVNLRKGKLSGARLNGADLRSANLSEANLSGSRLVGVNLSGANLFHADLSNAALLVADLSNAKLSEANLSNAKLYKTNLSNSDLSKASLANADLTKAELAGADLSRANLSNADLSEADLRMAIMDLAELTDARLTRAILSDALYTPISAPSKVYLSEIDGLRDVRFHRGGQAGLVLLRTVIKEAGLRDLEREATYAIERGKTMYAQGIEKWFRLIFFDWTSGYGLNYGRPIIILLLLMVPFALIYSFPISGRGESRLYMVWSEDRIEEDDLLGRPERCVEPLIMDAKNSHLRIIWFALYFSLLSAFRIGWRELNVGNWIARIQPREYTLQAKGWVRTVSGIQSLISIYLLALWVLVYFGRPFE